MVVGEERKQDPPVTDSDSEALDDARLLHEAFEEADGTVDEVLEQERRERGEDFEGVVEIVEKETDSAGRYLETEEAVEEMPVYEDVFPEDEERGEGFPGRYVRHEGAGLLGQHQPKTYRTFRRRAYVGHHEYQHGFITSPVPRFHSRCCHRCAGMST